MNRRIKDIITQYYESDESENVDVMYALPIETSVETILFEAEIGSRRIKKVVKELVKSKTLEIKVRKVK